MQSIQHTFMIRTLNKMDIEGMYLNIIKAICVKPSANIVVNGEELKAFPLRSGTGLGYPFSLLFVNRVLKVLARASGKRKSKRHTNWKNTMVTFCR